MTARNQRGRTPITATSLAFTMTEKRPISRAVKVIGSVAATRTPPGTWMAHASSPMRGPSNTSAGGTGGRRFDPSVQREFWYQHFHALAWSDRLIAHDRETVRLYLEYFYDHWCGRKEAIREREFEAIVDVYARPGAVKASIAYYRARAAQRQTQPGAPLEDSRIRQPTVIAWGELDPVILAAWADRLGETFLDHELSLLPGIGHFVPIEAPEQTIETIRRSLA